MATSHNPAGTVARANLWKTLRHSIVVRDGFNVRVDLGDIDDLANSIADNGLERALNVWRDAAGNFEVRDGHRRLAAIDHAIKAGRIDAATFQIPVMIADKSQTELEALAQMARANDGKPLLPYEQAQLFKRMQDAGMSVKDIAQAVGKGTVYTRDHLSLLNAAPEVVEAVKDGTIGKALALRIASGQRRGKVLDAAALVAAAKSGKAGKQAAMDTLEPTQVKVRALRVKIDTVKEEAAAKAVDIKERLESLGLSRAALKEQVGADVYEAIRAIGYEAGLKALVRTVEGEQ
jgi:ParB/RepB/Spo0J family partition protein